MSSKTKSRSFIVEDREMLPHVKEGVNGCFVVSKDGDRYFLIYDKKPEIGEIIEGVENGLAYTSFEGYKVHDKYYPATVYETLEIWKHEPEHGITKISEIFEKTVLFLKNASYDFQYHYICTTLMNLWYQGKTSAGTCIKALDYFKANIPTSILHEEFYYHESFIKEYTASDILKGNGPWWTGKEKIQRILFLEKLVEQLKSEEDE